MRASLDKDPRQVAEMFDEVATRYDLTNDVLTFGIDRWWRVVTREALAARPGERVLDLAAGTGSSTAEWARRGVDTVACDFSIGMVQVGKRRHPEIAFVAGDGMHLPFADESFDAVTISYGLRNIPDTELALREMRRVTKPGGRLLVLEFSTPTFVPFRGVYHWYLGTVLPALASVASSNTPAYGYLAESIRDWPDQRELARVIQRAGWRNVAYRNLTGGIVALHRARKN